MPPGVCVSVCVCVCVDHCPRFWECVCLYAGAQYVWMCVRVCEFPCPPPHVHSRARSSSPHSLTASLSLSRPSPRRLSGSIQSLNPTTFSGPLSVAFMGVMAIGLLFAFFALLRCMLTYGVIFCCRYHLLDSESIARSHAR